MSPARSPTQQAASRANGAHSRGPVTGAGKAKAARNGTRHGLRGGPFALLPGEDREEFAQLHAAVTADWSPRDAYERRWVRELVAALWRQERLRGLELATLAAAEQEHPPTEATVKRLLTFARYGARIDKDMTMALRALRVLRDRPDAHIAETQESTSEPKPAPPEPRNATPSARTFEPERPTLATRPADPPTLLNRHERRRLKALGAPGGVGSPCRPSLARLCGEVPARYGVSCRRRPAHARRSPPWPPLRSTRARRRWRTRP
jgi:hypothetical protein